MPNQTSDLKNHFKYQKFDTGRILQEFKKDIHLNVFFRNRDNLLENSTLVYFQKGSWRMKPDVFCIDHYKDPYIFPVILMINNLGSVFEFIPENLVKELIIAPNKNNIIKLLSL